MLIRRHQARREGTSNEEIVWDYPTGDSLGMALQELNGRVPASGRYRNSMCHEANYVLGGQATVFVDNQSYYVEPGDVFVIKPGQKSYLIGYNLRILTATAPNWYAEQCELVED